MTDLFSLRSPSVFPFVHPVFIAFVSFNLLLCGSHFLCTILDVLLVFQNIAKEAMLPRRFQEANIILISITLITDNTREMRFQAVKKRDDMPVAINVQRTFFFYLSTYFKNLSYIISLTVPWAEVFLFLAYYSTESDTFPSRFMSAVFAHLGQDNFLKTAA